MSVTLDLLSAPQASPAEIVQKALVSTLLRDTLRSAVEGSVHSEVLCSLTMPMEGIDPLAALEILGKPESFRYYWEHPDEELAIAAGEEVIRIRTQQPDRFHFVANQMDAWKERTVSFSAFPHSLSGIHFLGGFAFHNQPQSHHWRDFGSAGFIIPEWLIIRDGQLTLLTLTYKVSTLDTYSSLFSRIESRLLQIVTDIKAFNGSDSALIEGLPYVDEDALWLERKPEFLRSVEHAIKQISNGVFSKVVLAREVIIPLKRAVCVTHMLNTLRTQYPTCYTFLFQLNRNAAFVGSSPERLASFRSTILLTEGLAGSASRGKTATEDASFEKSLLQSDKELHEHRVVVDAIGHRLRGYSDDVHYPANPTVRKYPNVQHLYTPISAQLPEQSAPITILEALHPTPAVGGFPRDASLRSMQELENLDRGWFAGPLGWFNTHGRGEFCVGIRSGLIEPHRAHLFAGCGIVANSNPESEWNETLLKLVPMRTALRHG
jgi:menaquinone-specific isochorismate synthase